MLEKIAHVLAIRLLCASMLAASVARVAPASDVPILVHGGRIVTNDGRGARGSTPSALLIKDGRIAAIGTLEELSQRADARGACRVDLHGAVAVPGLQDAHGDLEALGASLVDLDLSGAHSYEDVVSRAAERAAVRAPGSWIVARGWNPVAAGRSSEPHHLLLSAATPKNPVCIFRSDGHAVLLNAAALAAVKLDGVLDPEPRIPGGSVVLGPDKRATGLLLDGAMALAEKAIPDIGFQARARRLLAVQDLLVARGITCVHDMGTSHATLAALQSLRAQGRLVLRVVCYPDCPADLHADTSSAFAGLPMAPDAEDRLCAPGVRIVLDGSLGARGAALLEDYADAPGVRGTLLVSEDDLGRRLSAVVRAGLQPAIEATGDRATRIALDALDRMGVVVQGFRDARPRIENAEVVAPKDWPRFPALGVIPSMQPESALSERFWLSSRIGEARTRGAHAWRTLAPELGRLALGSAFPTERADPLTGLYAARTRPGSGASEDSALGGGERLDGTAALAAFTSGAAYACRQEERRGRLAPGFGADITVLGVDPTSCDPDELLHAHVLLTVINGRIVFRSGETVGVEVR